MTFYYTAKKGQQQNVVGQTLFLACKQMAFGGGNAGKAGNGEGTVCGQCISNSTFLPTFDKLPHKF